MRIRNTYPVLAVALFVAVVSREIRDNSFLWHVRAGAVEHESGHVLVSDPFSYTMTGESWRTQSWLAELVYAQLESLTGGILWAPTLVLVLGTATLVLIAITIYGRTTSPVVTAAGIVLTVWLALPFGQPRPVIFSFLLLAALGLVLAVGPGRLMWLIPGLLWVWAGIHGSWVLGLGFVVLVAISYRSLRLFSVAALSLIFVSLTAHGLGVWEILVDFLTNRSALAYMSEWQPPAFGDLAQGPYLLVVAGVVAAASRGKIVPARLWIVIPFLVYGMTSERAVYPAAIVLIPYAMMAVDLRLPARDRSEPGIAWTVSCLALVAAVALFLSRPVGLDEGRFASSEAIAAAGTGHFFHSDANGGYLIYESWPEALVYIDDRAELYGAAMLDEYQRAVDGQYEELFARLDMRSAIVDPEWPLARALERAGWNKAFEDDNFVVLARSD